MYVYHDHFLFSFVIIIPALLGHQPAQHGTPEQLYSQEGIYYFDKANTRLASNVTVLMLNTQQPAQQVYEIQDFSKVMHYNWSVASLNIIPFIMFIIPLRTMLSHQRLI